MIGRWRPLTREERDARVSAWRAVGLALLPLVFVLPHLAGAGWVWSGVDSLVLIPSVVCLVAAGFAARRARRLRRASTSYRAR